MQQIERHIRKNQLKVGGQPGVALACAGQWGWARVHHSAP